MEAIFAVINTTSAMVIRPEKNSGFYRILTRYLRDTNAVLHQVALIKYTINSDLSTLSTNIVILVSSNAQH